MPGFSPRRLPSSRCRCPLLVKPDSRACPVSLNRPPRSGVAAGRVAAGLSIDEAVNGPRQNLGIQISARSQIQTRHCAGPIALGAAVQHHFTRPQEQPFVNILRHSAKRHDRHFFSASRSPRTALGRDYARTGTIAFTTNIRPTPSTPGCNRTCPELHASLLRNRSIDQIRQQVANSRKFATSRHPARSVIVQTTRAVRNAYWTSRPPSQPEGAAESLALAQQSLKDNQKRVEIGTMAPIDIVQAQAEVASNEERVIVADAAIKRAQDNLRALILDPSTTDFWNTALEPSDAAPFEEQAIDTEAAVRNALDKRADLRQAKNTIDRSDSASATSATDSAGVTRR